MKVEQIDSFLELWDANKLEQLWDRLNKNTQPDLAFTIAWMTTMIRDDGEVRLSQWIVWLETKSNNQ
jgi:hypothetical protein|tara:strand:+ start:506 stop:706 length:201 start_codon:yes stop_codon:yes gene_type:complete